MQMFEITPAGNLHAAERSQLSALFSSLWVLAGFSAEVWTPIIKPCLLFLITFQRLLTSIFWAPKKTQTIVVKPLVLIGYLFMQI